MRLASELDGDFVARDALGELCSIGAGNAVTSLNRLLGRGRIELGLPELASVTETPGDLRGTGLVVRLGIEGAVRGQLLALFDGPSACRLAGLLLGRTCAEPLAALEESAVVEAVNIISCSFLGALAALCGGVLMPTPPAAHWGDLRTLWCGQQAAEPTVALSNRFRDPALGFAGRLALMLPVASAGEVLGAVGLGGR